MAMSNRTDLATHLSLSLPSFAQAFSSSSINSISNSGNALPPIQSQSRPSSPPFTPRTINSPLRDEQRRADQNLAGRKRTFRESSDTSPEDAAPSKPPPVICVKEEPDREDLGQSSASSSNQSRSYQPSWPTNEHPLSSSTKPATTTKRRRVTISSINTDVKKPSSDANTPISPVVMGFAMRDDPETIEQVRSMLNVKQQQKALIEQRRNSNAGLSSAASPITNAPPTVHITNGPETRHSATTPRPSSNAGAANARRVTVDRNNSTIRNPTPPPMVTSGQQQHAPQPDPHHQPGTSMTHALPPPPISFAHRRAARLGAKAKPADILISPQEKQASEQMQPSIMSAPPAPHGGSHGPGRFSMAIPSLPPAVTSGQGNTRMTASAVPPTPTRLGGPRTAIPSFGRTSSQIGLTGRSPPTASVPISSTLVPPTPSSLHRPHYTSEKTAFLTPFEMFYDALSDSKHLKAWLGEQLKKSNSLINSMEKQENIEELVGSLVEKRVVGMRDEIYGLKKRVEELEHALGITQAPGSQLQGGTASSGKGKARATEFTSDGPESYTFPPVPAVTRRPDLPRRMSSPSRADMEGGSTPGSHTSSPAPPDAGRRLSVSSVRFDPRPGPLISERSHNHGNREGFSALTPPSKSSSSKLSRSPVNNALLPRPHMHRQHSQPLNNQASSGQRKSGPIDKHPQAPEDLNFNDNGGKRGGTRDDYKRRESADIRRRSNSSAEAS